MIWSSSIVGIVARPAMDTRAAVAANSGTGGEPATTGTGFLLVARAHADSVGAPWTCADTQAGQRVSG